MRAHVSGLRIAALHCLTARGLRVGRMAVLGELSDRSPALATFNGRLFIAWKGNGNFHLNVMSSHDGVTFDHATKITFDEFTPVGPALAAFDGRLFLAWTGTDEFALLNVMSSADGVTWG